MALEQAQYINQLVVSNPQSTDTVAQADDHIRLIKATLKATFPNITGPVTVTQNTLNTPIPTGLIAMWSGAINAVPSGWALCDGTNGTPNLRDRFVVGAGSTYAVGATGGANSVTLTEAQLPTHTHTITASSGSAGDHVHGVNDPGHVHSYATPGGTGTIGAGFGLSVIGAATGAAGTGISIAAAGAHTHTITATASSVGGSQAHENRPPYYALAYIMKV